MSGWSASFGATAVVTGQTESMTRTTRRTTRNSASQLPGSDAIESDSPAAETDPAYTQEDLCPSCNVSLSRDQAKNEDSESWVRCDFCKTWYHWRCVGENGQLETIDKWSVSLRFICHALDSLHNPGSVVPVEPPIVNELSPSSRQCESHHATDPSAIT